MKRDNMEKKQVTKTRQKISKGKLERSGGENKGGR